MDNLEAHALRIGTDLHASMKLSVFLQRSGVSRFFWEHGAWDFGFRQ